mgnify:CR=1 FL=1
MKAQRQAKIVEIISNANVETQEQLLQAQHQQIETTLKRLNYKISRYERAVKTGVLSWEADGTTEENCHVLGND